jgi:polyhydroxyalkanoate synthesis repressor PhaR
VYAAGKALSLVLTAWDYMATTLQLIKKYANRKLYHTNQKHYITLEGIARLIQDGATVQVLDNETGADITSSILIQIVLQQRTQGSRPLPANYLLGLIQLGSGALSNLQRVIFASLGGQHWVDAEINQRLEQLESTGELSTDEVSRLRALLVQPAQHDPLPGTDDQTATVPTRSDIARLQQQIDALAAAIEQFARHQPTPDQPETPTTHTDL